MKSKNIVGINKELDNLKLKLQSVAEQLRENIDDDSKKTEKLLKEYKKIQEQIEMEEEKIVTEQRRQEAEIKAEEKRMQQKYDDMIKEQEEIIREIQEDKDNAIQEFEDRQSEIKQRIGELEYEREECLQTLKSIQLERIALEQELEIAKAEDDIHKRIEIKQKMQELESNEKETDSELEKIKARLAIRILIKTARDKKEIEKIKRIIEEYNKNASEYGLEKIDLPEFVKSHRTEEQLENIRKENQKKYHREDIGNTATINLANPERNATCGKLTDEEREKIEKESQERVEYRRKNMLPVRIIRNVGTGIARVAGTVVGATILAGKTIARGAQSLWNNIRKNTNKTLSGANKLMLKGTTKLREKLEEDSQTFEKRREKLTSNLKTSVDEEKAVQASNENNEEQNPENVK